MRQSLVVLFGLWYRFVATQLPKPTAYIEMPLNLICTDRELLDKIENDVVEVRNLAVEASIHARFTTMKLLRTAWRNCVLVNLCSWLARYGVEHINNSLSFRLCSGKKSSGITLIVPARYNIVCICSQGQRYTHAGDRRGSGTACFVWRK